MNRLLVGIAIGAALVYFLDQERGEARRQRASDWASQYVNADTIDQAKQAGQATLNQARSLGNQVSSQVSNLRTSRRSTANDVAADALAPATSQS